MTNDSIATNLSFLHDFLSSATVEGIASCTAEQAQRLSEILHCDTPDGPNFATVFPDDEITAYRDASGNPLHGGRSRKYWARQSAWTPAAILGRQRNYIQSSLLPNSRYKAYQLLNGRRFTEHAILLPETQHIFDSLKNWLTTYYPPTKGKTTD